MTIMKWKSYPSNAHLFDNMFDRLAEGIEHKKYQCSPSVNILENEKGFEIELAAPGMRKEDFKISLESNVLTLSSESGTENDDKSQYIRKEFSTGNFSRSFTLPKSIQTENISAEYTNGILHIRLPKREDLKLSKQITIS